jgi:hypothetical protein
MSYETLIRTLRGDDSAMFPANITANTTMTELVARAAEPSIGVMHANEVAIVGAAPNWMNVQMYSESGASLDVRVFGFTWCAAVGLWSVRALLQFRATMHTVGPGSNLFLGDTLFPALTHVINLNNSNAKALDGSAAYKIPGSISFDTHGLKYVGFGINRVSGTPKANGLVSVY